MHSASKELESKCFVDLATRKIIKMQSFKGYAVNLIGKPKKQLMAHLYLPKFYEKVNSPEIEIFGHLTSLVKFSMLNRFLEFLMHSFQPDL